MCQQSQVYDFIKIWKIWFCGKMHIDLVSSVSRVVIMHL